MIGYSGIYSPNNKKNQESITIRLVYSQNSENRESRNYKCMDISLLFFTKLQFTSFFQ